MGGKYSRDKGKRNEYLVRDAIRAEGFPDCARVPSSGSAQGFKGDLEFTGPTGRVKVEVKSRASAFGAIYKYLEGFEGKDPWAVFEPVGANLFVVAWTLKEAMETAHFYDADLTDPKELKAIRKALKLKEFLGECQVLVIKDDRKAPLFIVYHG